MESSKGPLIVIVGPTASGKSALAIKLAEKFNGEIICADSRTVYRGMDMGTAKPTRAERLKIPHHLLDIVDVDERFTVAQFQKLANQAIDAIHSRNSLPILVGGSGLYIDSILYDYEFTQDADQTERERLSKLSVEELQQEIRQKGLNMPFNHQNPRHLMRTLETGGVSQKRKGLRQNTLVIGLVVDKLTLKRKIEGRVDKMIKDGLVEETEMLFGKYGEHAEALQSTSYKAIKKYLSGQLTLEEAKNEFSQNDMSLAKRQLTWFKRNQSIQWINNYRKAIELVTTFLNNKKF